MSSIKTNFEMPRGDDPVKQAQRLSQDLSSNFKAVSKQITDIKNTINSAVSSQFIDLTYTLNLGTGTPVTLSHNLGIIPTGWYIIDATVSPFNDFSVNRVSWDTVNLTVQGAGTLLAGTGIFKIRVFI